VAGLVDGEGTICANKRTQGDYQLQVAIYNTSLKLMRWLVERVGGRFYVRSCKSWNGKEGKPQYMWLPSGKRNREEFLLAVLPYLVIKTEQAKLALEFLRLPYGSSVQREELAQKISLLNRREESVTTNTLNGSEEPKIESGLAGDSKSAPVVTQTA